MTGSDYAILPPERAEIDAGRGALVLEFGTAWCGWCRAAQPLLDSVFENHPDVRRVRVEDGPGRPLGRSYKVKLWPTLIFVLNGEEVARVVRPNDPAVLKAAFDCLSRTAG